MTLDVLELVATQPFNSVEIDNFYMEKTPILHGEGAPNARIHVPRDGDEITTSASGPNWIGSDYHRCGRSAS